MHHGKTAKAPACESELEARNAAGTAPQFTPCDCSKLRRQQQQQTVQPHQTPIHEGGSACRSVHTSATNAPKPQPMPDTPPPDLTSDKFSGVCPRRQPKPNRPELTLCAAEIATFAVFFVCVFPTTRQSTMPICSPRPFLTSPQEIQSPRTKRCCYKVRCLRYSSRWDTTVLSSQRASPNLTCNAVTLGTKANSSSTHSSLCDVSSTCNSRVPYNADLKSTMHQE
jgi:hypothetical protein